MLFAYVDESERDSTFYFLGALVVSEAQAQRLSRNLDALMAKHAETFPALVGAELHGSTMMRASEEPWRSIPLRIRLRLFEEAVQLVADSNARVYVEGVDIRRQIARGYPSITPARELAFSHLFERVNECCGWDEPQVRVIADEHHTADVSRSNFSRYRNVGTYGYRSSKLPNIHPTIDFIASHTDRVLQAADLVTYLYNRVQTVSERDRRAHEHKHKMWASLADVTSWPHGRARTWP